MTDAKSESKSGISNHDALFRKSISWILIFRKWRKLDAHMKYCTLFVLTVRIFLGKNCGIGSKISLSGNGPCSLTPPSQRRRSIEAPAAKMSFKQSKTEEPSVKQAPVIESSSKRIPSSKNGKACKGKSI